MPGPADATPVVEAQKRAPAELKAVADFLRGKNGPKVRRGILNGKRVDYFTVPTLKDEDEAKALMAKMLPHAFFLRVDRPVLDPPPPSGTPKTLLLAPQQSFDPLVHYAWFYDGSPLWTILGGLAMVGVMLAGVMFPLWPVKLRLGVWYLSVGALGLVGAFIVLAIVRLIFWCITVVTRTKAIWIFPNLFEDVGFVDSFIPLWAYDEPKKKKKRPAGSAKDGGKRRKDKKAGADAGAGVGAEDAGVGAGASSALETPVPVGNATRRSATIEEIDDDEA
ncbi:Translocation protein S62 [Saitozyma podzolica]|uniref:Translocation protein SEC62 n=1 Tax=Saitozyma podzolica TaxID=1890683 RepID=A0A427YXA6_9TREE|nr:Translocation protein S62 [Saitozyma podzolica]